MDVLDDGGRLVNPRKPPNRPRGHAAGAATVHLGASTRRVGVCPGGVS